MNNFRVKHKALFCVVVTSIFIMTLSSPILASFVASFPEELGNWRLSSEYVTELTGPENLGNVGKWTSASYVRSEPRAGIEVQLTEGPGPGEFFVPEGMIFSDDGPIGFSSTYETLSVAGRRSVLERSDVAGQALAVALETRTITFETRGISREELLTFAESMIEALQYE